MKSLFIPFLVLVFGSAAFAQAPSDSQIAKIVVTANKADIDGGKLALSKTKNADVKAFAKQMVTDHTRANEKVTALAKKLKVTPEDSETSTTLEHKASANLADLKKLSGKEFDKTYINKEVETHETVLNEIDNTLIPNAKNPELKALVERIRPEIAAHLAHAKSIQSKLE